MTRANLSKLKEEYITENRVLNTSLLPLVEDKDIAVNDKSALKGAQAKLVNNLA